MIIISVIASYCQLWRGIQLFPASILARLSHGVFDVRPYVLNGAIELDKLTVAEGFMQVLAHLDLEYDLPPDIWAVAEDVLQALKARETNWAPRGRPRS